MTQGTSKSKLKTEALVCLINVELDVSHLTIKNPLNVAAGLIPAARLPYLIPKHNCITLKPRPSTGSRAKCRKLQQTQTSGIKRALGIWSATQRKRILFIDKLFLFLLLKNPGPKIYDYRAWSKPVNFHRSLGIDFDRLWIKLIPK